MARLRQTLAAGMVAAALAAPASAQWNTMYFLGDSSTDAGFYNGARYTVNPGLVWAQDLGALYGLTITSVAVGGTDYAQGGSRVALDSVLIPPGVPQRPLTTQVTQLIAASGGALDPNALYGVSIGYNDLLENVAAAGAGAITPEQLQANIATAAAQEVQQIARLQAAGARFLVVFNIYNMGQSPFGVSQPAAPFTALTGLYNSTLNAGLDQVGGNVMRVNAQQLFLEMLANPSLFGFTNTSQTACTTATSLTCTTATLVAPNAASTFLFADGIHPTPPGYAAIAQVVESMLTGPAYIGGLAEAPLAVEQAQFRALDGRMWSALGTPGTANKLQAWAAYDYGNADLDASHLGSGNGNLNSVAVGLDMRLSPSALAGVAFGYTEDKSDFGNSAGSFKLRETSMTVYGGWGSGPWYLGGSLLLGNLDYNDVHRDIQFAGGTRTESGSAKGDHWAVRLLGGYWFTPATNLVHGPFAKIVYQEDHVNAFSETGSSSTALVYDKQKRESLITSLGWQAQGQWGMVRPFARATWEWEAKTDDRFVTAGSATLGGRYSVPTYKPDDNWGLFVLGASTDFGKVTGFLTGSATAGKNDGESYGVTIGVRVPL